jgi:hypothetical protein
MADKARLSTDKLALIADNSALGAKYNAEVSNVH